MHRRAVAIAAIAATGLLGAAWIAGAQVPRDFTRVLAPMARDARLRLEAQAAAWADWSPAMRRAFGERAAAWDALPVPERRARRDTWQAWRMLAADERRRLQVESARLGALAPAERAALRARFDTLDASTRRGWMLGPALGADYPRLQPLLAQVPAPLHADLLRTLRAMTPVQRADLAVLVQRTPPAERDALRRELVSTSAGNREGWLRMRLDR